MKNVLWSEVMNLCSNLLYEKPPCLSMDCQTFKTKKETCKGLFHVYSVFMKLNQWMVPEEQRVLLQQQQGLVGNYAQ